MTVRKITLVDDSTGTEFVFPVTPESFSVSFGRSVEKVNLYAMGEVHFWGQKTAATVKVSALFPSGARSYAFAGGYTGNPYGAVEQLKRWQEAGKVLRYIVSDTPVNMPVLLSNVSYGEKDGTGDVYAEIELKEHRQLSAVRTAPGAQKTGARDEGSGGAYDQDQSYTIVSGDTMWAVAREFYGDGNLCWKLAAHNGIKNANIIYPGTVLKIPPKEQLA